MVIYLTPIFLFYYFIIYQLTLIKKKIPYFHLFLFNQIIFYFSFFSFHLFSSLLFPPHNQLICHCLWLYIQILYFPFSSLLSCQIVSHCVNLMCYICVYTRTTPMSARFVGSLYFTFLDIKKYVLMHINMIV